MKRINLSAKIEQEIVQAYGQDRSLNELSMQYKVSRSKIKEILQKHDVVLRPKKETVKLLQRKVHWTLHEKYGVDNAYQLDYVKEKSKKTCLAHFGVEHASQSDSVKEKIKTTCVLHFGVENPLQSSAIKEKVKKTCEDKWGGAWTSSKPETQEKVRQTKYARYGSITYNNLEKAKKTNLEKYGVSYGFQTERNRRACHSELANEKRKISVKTTCLRKYGVEYITQTDQIIKSRHSVYTFNDEKFDSYLELAVYKYCIDHSISVIRQPCRFKYELDGKKHYYFPDFEINGRLVEIKGDHFIKEDGSMQNPFDHSQDALYEAKRQCIIKNNVEI